MTGNHGILLLAQVLDVVGGLGSVAGLGTAFALWTGWIAVKP